MYLSMHAPGIHTERENGAVVLVHQRGVRVLDLVDVVEVLLGNHDLVGDITGDGWTHRQYLCPCEDFSLKTWKTY